MNSSSKGLPKGENGSKSECSENSEVIHEGSLQFMIHRELSEIFIDDVTEIGEDEDHSDSPIDLSETCQTECADTTSFANSSIDALKSSTAERSLPDPPSELIRDDSAPNSVPKMDHFLCNCGQTIAVPSNISVFKCPMCGQILQRPKELTKINSEDIASKEEDLRQRYYTRWLIKEAVSRELDIWLNGDVNLVSNENSLIGRFYQKVISFPLFKDKSSGIDSAIKEIFLVLPEIDRRRRKIRGKARRSRIVSLIASPIFYASFVANEEIKQLFPEDTLEGAREMFHLSLVKLLSQLNTEENVRCLIQSLTSCHSMEELPECLKVLINSRIRASALSLEDSLAKPKAKSRFKSLFKVIPRYSILRLLRSKIIGTGSKMFTSILLTKPFGQRSILQHIVSSSMGLKHVEKQLRELKRALPIEIQSRCLAYLRFSSDLDDYDSLFEMSDKQILEVMLSDEYSIQLQAPSLPLEVQYSIRKEHAVKENIREFLTQELLRQDIDILVQFMGDDRVENLLQTVVPVVQNSLFGTLFEKHSGFLPLVETAFAAWEDILATYKSSMSIQQKLKSYEKWMEKLFSLAYGIVRNVLSRDFDGKFHETIYWTVNSWNSSKLDINLDEMLSSVTLAQREQVLADAEELRCYYIQKNNKLPGEDVPRKPVLTNDFLVDSVKEKLVHNALPSPQQMRSTNKYFQYIVGGKNSTSFMSDKDEAKFIYYVDILYDGEETRFLRSNGYQKVNTPIGTNGKERAWFWFKMAPNKPKPEANLLDVTTPITAFRVTYSESTCAKSLSLEKDGYIKIRRRLNRTGGHVYLWYKRENGGSPVKSISVTLEDENTDLNRVKEKALKRSGYSKILPGISPRGNKTPRNKDVYFWQELEPIAHIWVKH